MIRVTPSLERRKKIPVAAWRKIAEYGDWTMPIHDKPHVVIALSYISAYDFPDLPEVRKMLNKIFAAADRFGISTRGLRKLYPWLVN